MAPDHRYFERAGSEPAKKKLQDNSNFISTGELL